jgi:hypothetical protein
MKWQVWFETDLGYAATKDRLLDSRAIIGDPSGDYCGRLTFRFKGLKDFTLQITTKSKIGITYPENSDYKIVLERLKPLLVKPDGSPAEILRITKHITYNHTSSQNKDNDDSLNHSKSLILTAKDAETEFDLRVDQYGPDIILRMFLSDEHSYVPLTRYDRYFLQHIETGYPEISELVEKWKSLSNHKKEMQDIGNLIVEKINTIIDGVDLGTPLLGHCDCCP